MNIKQGCGNTNEFHDVEQALPVYIDLITSLREPHIKVHNRLLG
jgi:hypothetical protein